MRSAMRKKWKPFGMKLEFVEGLTLHVCLLVCTFFFFSAAVAFELVGVVTLASKLTGLQHGRSQCLV